MLSGFSFINPVVKPIVEDVTPISARVYVCGGPYSKKFHSISNCRGLNNCSTEIYYYASQREALNNGYDYCKICWR